MRRYYVASCTLVRWLVAGIEGLEEAEEVREAEGPEGMEDAYAHAHAPANAVGWLELAGWRGWVGVRLCFLCVFCVLCVF